MALETSMKFLKFLKKNNNRDWFNENKDLYNEAKKEFELFVKNLIPILQSIDDDIDVLHARDSIFRIFRDVRFSKDKSPYKPNFGAFIARGGRKGPFAGFYIHLEPGSSFIGGGAYMPEPKFLKAIRTEIYENTDNYKKIINRKNFKDTFGGIFGDKLKLAPKGFPKEFEYIELLKNKHYAVSHEVKDSFWKNDKVVNELKKIFKLQYPFNEFINRAVEKEI